MVIDRGADAPTPLLRHAAIASRPRIQTPPAAANRVGKVCRAHPSPEIDGPGQPNRPGPGNGCEEDRDRETEPEASRRDRAIKTAASEERQPEAGEQRVTCRSAKPADTRKLEDHEKGVGPPLGHGRQCERHEQNDTPGGQGAIATKGAPADAGKDQGHDSNIAHASPEIVWWAPQYASPTP